MPKLNWTTVAAFALTLPGCEPSTSYGRPSVKVRKKMFACTGKQDDHFVCVTTAEDKQALLDNHPDTFFQTHYENSAAVLARYTGDSELIELMVERAWHRRASKAQRNERESQ